MGKRQRKAKVMLPCMVCGEPVVLSSERYLDLVRTDTLPVCRRNGCYRYVGQRERSGGAKNTGTARSPQSIAIPAVACARYELGTGRTGHQHAPLANGRVKRVLAAGCVAGLTMGE